MCARLIRPHEMRHEQAAISLLALSAEPSQPQENDMKFKTGLKAGIGIHVDHAG